MNELIDRVLYLINNIKTHKENGERSPHKFVFLLALAALYQANPRRENEFRLDNELEVTFTNAWFSFLDKEAVHNAIEYPFYHLQTDGCWKLKIMDEKLREYAFYEESPSQRLTKKRLTENVEYGYLSDDFDKCFRSGTARKAVVNFISNLLKKDLIIDSSSAFERLSFDTKLGDNLNPFVAYLNSLHCRDAGSENALAESQACNPWFKFIEIPHPLVTDIRDCLVGHSSKHVILTGHAGDGKSTIALEVYRYLRNLPPEEPLPEPLKPHEYIALPDSKPITIIKDLSEWGDDQRLELFGEILKSEKNFLLVSNTGTLLNLFCDYGTRHLNQPRIESETMLLEAINSERRRDLKFGNNNFAVFNLALADNLSIAKRVFDRMLNSDRWRACAIKDCHHGCPIYRNVLLLSEYGNIAKTRLFMAYRRMYEYGTRLTLRQLTAHLAYLMTSGLECAGIQRLSERHDKPLMSEFMFYNRFFGDDGKTDDISAVQLRAVKEIRKQGFGERPCPSWERQLWLLTRDKYFTLGVPVVEDEFDKLRQYGSGIWNPGDSRLSADQARDQVRRMLYFLYKFPNDEELFVRQFLASPAVMKWWGWQSDEARLSLDESATFKQQVFHVLQEQFTGVRLPETGGGDQKLYITLSRHKQDIRQSAQVVLAQIDFGSEFSLELSTVENSWGAKRKDLCLIGRGRLKGIRMPLTLPFLDYVLMRHCGEAGEVLHAAYAERLERLKAQLLKLGDRVQSDDILLVRLRTNHTFLRQHFAVHDNKLEVANA